MPDVRHTASQQFEQRAVAVHQAVIHLKRGLQPDALAVQQPGTLQEQLLARFQNQLAAQALQCAIDKLDAGLVMGFQLHLVQDAASGLGIRGDTPGPWAIPCRRSVPAMSTFVPGFCNWAPSSRIRLASRPTWMPPERSSVPCTTRVPPTRTARGHPAPALP